VKCSWHNQAVALTGSSGSGKSTVAEIFKRLGAETISADQLAGRALAQHSPGLAEVVKYFGSGVVHPDGSLNRAELGRIIFADKEKRAILEQFTHPIIAYLAEAEAERRLAGNPPLLVYDCPLLFETGLDRLGFQEIVVVVAEQELCISRIMRRDGLSDGEARNRLAAQFPVEEKQRRAGIVIDNSGTPAELELQVKKIYSELVQRNKS